MRVTFGKITGRGRLGTRSWGEQPLRTWGISYRLEHISYWPYTIRVIESGEKIIGWTYSMQGDMRIARNILVVISEPKKLSMNVQSCWQKKRPNMLVFRPRLS
jgi:hypothetical protein